MVKAVGIGGVILQFKGDEKKLFEWYRVNLGLDMSNYGTGFTKDEQLVLLTFKRLNEKSHFINFYADDIDALFNNFNASDLRIVDDVKEYEYVKFRQFEDPFGNIIELLYPYIDAYINMVE